ncbi:MAG: alpha/beta hydrolase [Bacteroidota bacterium]
MEHLITEEGEFKFIEQGEGPIILVLHGLFGALSNFKDVFSGFSDKYKVVIPMLPIYELPLLKCNVKNLADFLHRFIEFKQYESLNLLGNSLGGHVALVHAAAHPDKINSVTLTGSSGLYENAFGGTFPRREDKRYLREKIALTFFDPAMVTDELVDECHEAVNNRNKVLRILSIAKSAIRHNMASELPNYSMPFCLIWGKNDTITPPEVAEEFHEKITDSDLYWIDKCGHAPMMEHPEKFNDILKAWFKDRGI